MTTLGTAPKKLMSTGTFAVALIVRPLPRDDAVASWQEGCCGRQSEA